VTETGKTLEDAAARAAVTKHVIIDAGALAAAPALAARLFPGRKLLIVADENTFGAAGKNLSARLDAGGVAMAEPVLLPGKPRLKPRVEAGQAIAARIRDSGAVPVAVGSGVVNDLTKYAAGVEGVPYLCVATAASMDGYSASGAALVDNGFKRTFPCPPPVAVVADLDIVASAPKEMARWGYGDLAGKLAAGADWLVADAVGEEAVDTTVWHMVQGPLAGWLADPASVAAHAPHALKGLTEGLLVSGLAMQAYGNSRPASGSDHQFSHLWEMEGLAIGSEPVAHGTCVALGCLSSLALFQWLLGRDLSTIEPTRLAAARPAWPDVEAAVRAAFADPVLAASALEEMRAKYHPPERVIARIARFLRAWPGLRERLREELPSPAALREKLVALGAPVSPAAVGIVPERHARDHLRARMIRRRYTIFDLLFDLGWFETALRDLFGEGGFWGPAAAARSSDANKSRAREEVR
jgi:glycerol-1-phosphate dehydrogenase [NAD(P)+]